MDKKWAQSLLSREQHILFPVTLDDIVPANHAIRILDAILDTCDWNQWEIHYNGHRGQPPIHPRLMAGCILYGLLRSIRSSRGLEDATRERKDFRFIRFLHTYDLTNVDMMPYPKSITTTLEGGPSCPPRCYTTDLTFVATN